MARAKFSAPPEKKPDDTGETDNWTSFFEGESNQIVVNVKRIEPAMHQGIQVGGHLAQLTLTPEEAQQLPNLLIQKWGGGLYGIQWLRRKDSGGYSFDHSFRIRCAGVPRLEAPAVVQPAPTPAPAQPAQMWSQPMHPGPYPWQQNQPQQQSAVLQELPRLLGQVVEIARSGQTSPNGQALDTVALVQALQSAVRPEDDFSKFERFATLMNKLTPKTASTAAEVVTSVDWMALAGAASEFIRNFRVPAPAPNQAQTVMQRGVQPVAPVSAPPGWRFDGQKWIELDEEEEEEEEEEGEGEEENAEIPRPPMSAEQLAEEFARMDPAEQQKIAALAAQFANVPA